MHIRAIAGITAIPVLRTHYTYLFWYFTLFFRYFDLYSPCIFQSSFILYSLFFVFTVCPLFCTSWPVFSSYSIIPIHTLNLLNLSGVEDCVSFILLVSLKKYFCSIQRCFGLYTMYIILMLHHSCYYCKFLFIFRYGSRNLRSTLAWISLSDP